MVMTPRIQSDFEQVRELALTAPNLTLLHGVPDVRPYYDRAVALVNMSIVEGFPNTFLEAAMSSTPIVSISRIRIGIRMTALLPEEERVDAAAHPVDILADARDRLSAAGEIGACHDE